MRQPEIGALVAGNMTVLIRPLGRLSTLGPGALLWVREPFYLGGTYDDLSPTAAVARGALPTFVVDHSPGWLARRAELLGRRRHARELPRVCHRQHLAVISIDRVQLHDVAGADIRSAGWRDINDVRRRWDADAMFPGPRLAQTQIWKANPAVLRIAFARVDAPAPDPNARRRDPVSQPEGV